MKIYQKALANKHNNGGSVADILGGSPSDSFWDIISNHFGNEYTPNLSSEATHSKDGDSSSISADGQLCGMEEDQDH
ncbi:putative Formate acetyltransferase 2 [Sesbania bispinosa]|nr:putative Formate acetyltransferase 2 [Sesbania bispinosa]